MTANFTVSNGSATYVFVPMNYKIKITFAAVYGILGVHGVVANVLILVFLLLKNRRHPQRPSIRILTDLFIQSLALSDVLQNSVNVPFYTVEMFVDFIKTKLACQAGRVTIVFQCITVVNYLVIGIERYVGIYHPFLVPSDSVCKKLIVAAWCVGVLIVSPAFPSYDLVRYDLDNNIYTHVCSPGNAVKLYNILALVSVLLIWVIPCTILTFTCIQILRFLRRNRRVTHDANPPAANLQTSTHSRYKVTTMLVYLIFVCIIPHMLFMIYNTILMILGIQLSFTDEYLMRRISVIIMFTKSSVSSTILFYNHSYLRRELKRLFR